MREIIDLLYYQNDTASLNRLPKLPHIFMLDDVRNNINHLNDAVLLYFDLFEGIYSSIIEVDAYGAFRGLDICHENLYLDEESVGWMERCGGDGGEEEDATNDIKRWFS
jgi:hypothetical protein